MTTTPAEGNRVDYNALLDDDFRALVRRWIEENYPPHLRYPIHRLHRRDTKVWYDLLAARGWLAPGWAKEYGGMGLDASKRVIMIEELERHGCSRFNDQGVLMIGPLLMRFGTQAQRDFFLPRIMTGEHIWAQGYSEPNSGSDLASLRTEAVDEGDHWLVNGQKIWTTLANDANWIYLLVRTDKKAKKQEGISFLLVPMDTPGITLRPIITMDMSDDFCEVFFDNVRVAKDHLVGELNKGWTMAKALLGFERIFVGSPAQSAYALSRLKTLAISLGVWTEQTVRQSYTRLALDLEDHRSLYETFIAKLRRGEVIGPDVSMLKVNQTELYKRITQTTVDLAGQFASFLDAPADGSGVQPAPIWLHSLQTTIFGGTSEIQRDIIAKHVLALPT